jgi:hypothetical protein
MNSYLLHLQNTTGKENLQIFSTGAQLPGLSAPSNGKAVGAFPLLAHGVSSLCRLAP